MGIDKISVPWYWWPVWAVLILWDWLMYKLRIKK